MQTNEFLLDVRDDFRAGRQPCTRIMDAAKPLAPGQVLRLVTPFQPVPLFSVLGDLGFRSESRQLAADHWETRFTREKAADAGTKPSGCGCHASEEPAKGGEATAVDARGLEPPEPMTRILAALEKLGAGGVLRATTDRRPVHLLGILDQRGFTHTGAAQADGSWVTEIRRG